MSSKTAIQKLADCPFGQHRNMQFHALEDDEYLAVIPNGYNAVTQKFEILIYRYSASTNRWTEEVMASLQYSPASNQWRNDDLAEYLLPRCSVYNPLSNCLYVVVLDDPEVKEINLRQSNITTRFIIPLKLVTLSKMKMLLSGTTLHIFATDFFYGHEHHLIIDISTHYEWKMLTQMHHSTEGWDYQSLVFCKPRNSIVRYERNGRDCSVHRLSEFCLSTKKWQCLNWSETRRSKRYWIRGTLMTSEGRYFLCFGGLSMNEGSRRIMIYDLERKEQRLSSIQCPLDAGYHATLLRNHAKEILCVFGFVNQSFKASKFRNLQVLPHYLIELIAKWYRNEQICLIAYTHVMEETASHWKVNVDDVISATSTSLVQPSANES